MAHVSVVIYVFYMFDGSLCPSLPVPCLFTSPVLLPSTAIETPSSSSSDASKPSKQYRFSTETQSDMAESWPRSPEGTLPSTSSLTSCGANIVVNLTELLLPNLGTATTQLSTSLHQCCLYLSPLPTSSLPYSLSRVLCLFNVFRSICRMPFRDKRGAVMSMFDGQNIAGTRDRQPVYAV